MPAQSYLYFGSMMSVLEWPKNDRFSDRHTTVATAFADSEAVATTSSSGASFAQFREGAFCELPVYGVLGSLHSPSPTPMRAKTPPGQPDFPVEWNEGTNDSGSKQ